MTSYLTIGRDAQAEVDVKRSRFLCTLRRVEDEPAARDVVERLRREHWDARHTCSAVVVGPGAEVQRSSDDGEPSGTAGAPMLEVLRGHAGEGVSDVVAVVTRWFGGTLLGAGGLVRAYGDAVRAALDDAGLLRRQLLLEHELVVPHADAGRLESELRSRGVLVLDTAYAEQVTLRVGVPEASGLAGQVAELTGGTVAVRAVGSRWLDVGGHDSPGVTPAPRHG